MFLKLKVQLSSLYELALCFCRYQFNQDVTQTRAKTELLVMILGAVMNVIVCQDTSEENVKVRTLFILDDILRFIIRH